MIMISIIIIIIIVNIIVIITVIVVIIIVQRINLCSHGTCIVLLLFESIKIYMLFLISSMHDGTAKNEATPDISISC